MKPATIIIFAFAAFVPIFSAIAQDVDDSGSDTDEFGRDRDEFGRDGDEFGGDADELDPDMKELGFGDEDIPADGRILGAVPAFGLGLLGGSVGSHLVRGVGSLLGLRSPAPALRPPAPAFFPAPYVPAGFPYQPFPGRDGKVNKRIPGREVPLTPYVPALPGQKGQQIQYVPVPVSFYRSEDDGEQTEYSDDNETY